MQDMPRVAMSCAGSLRGQHPVQLDHRSPGRRRGETDAAREGAAFRVRAGRPGDG